MLKKIGELKFNIYGSPSEKDKLINILTENGFVIVLDCTLTAEHRYTIAVESDE